MLYDCSFISQSIDEDHNLFNIINIWGFQPRNLGENPRKDNEHYFCSSPYRLPPLSNSNVSFLLTPSIKPRLWKTIPLWMRLWPPRICPPPILPTILPNCYLISSLWPRNCTPAPHSLSKSTRQPHPDLPMNLLRTLLTHPRPNLRMTPRGPRMSRVGG